MSLSNPPHMMFSVAAARCARKICVTSTCRVKSNHSHSPLLLLFQDCFRHEGNIRFRALIDTMLSQYTMSNSKKHKMQIIQYVCHYVVEGRGRFLKKDNRNKQWYDGGIACGKDKVSLIICACAVMSMRSNV